LHWSEWAESDEGITGDELVESVYYTNLRAN
jgi:hypothetical protein